MPKISSKGVAMPASPIRKLVPFATAAKAAGKNVIHLNIGQPDIHTPDVVMDRMRSMERSVIEYSDSEGFESYRQGLAKYYNNNDINISVNDLMVTTGGSEALGFAFLSCLNPGDEVIIPEPFYANYNGFAVTGGIKVVPVTASIDDGFALPSIAAFEAKITEENAWYPHLQPG